MRQWPYRRGDAVAEQIIDPASKAPTRRTPKTDRGRPRSRAPYDLPEPPPLIVRSRRCQRRGPDEENPGPRDDAVGYGKRPAHTRFRKGRSGNPGGRPRGITAGRATALALKELYRPVPVREGDKLITMPAIQAVLRSMIVLAAKGNCPAQRELIEIARGSGTGARGGNGSRRGADEQAYARSGHRSADRIRFDE
jgi:hypothetical protein